jgi:hypothetical protein
MANSTAKEQTDSDPAAQHRNLESPETKQIAYSEQRIAHGAVAGI